MIQKNDLRIGNLVLVHNHYVAEVISIGDKIGVKTVGEPKANIDYLDLEFISSIPINEKWLLDLGFEQIGNNGVHFKKDLLHWYKDSALYLEYDNGINGADIFIDIEFINQVQNLYYSIYLKELNHKI